jgi:hypothetical protein
MSCSIRLFSPLPAKDCAARLQRLLGASSGGNPRPPVEVLRVAATGARLRIRGRFLSTRAKVKFVPTPNGTRLVITPRFRLLRPLLLFLCLFGIAILLQPHGHTLPLALVASLLAVATIIHERLGITRHLVAAKKFLVEALGITGIVSSPELVHPFAPPPPSQPPRTPVPEIDDALPAPAARRDGIPAPRPADTVPPIRGRR